MSYDREFMLGVWDELYSRLGELDELQIVTAPGYLWHARYVAWAQAWAFRHGIDRIGGVRGRRVLDLGCGAGRWSRQLSDRGASVTGLDYSEEAIARARERVPGVEFMVTDIAREDLGSARYDVVLAATVLALLTPSEQRRAVDRIRDALVPGGWLVAMEDLTDRRRMPGVHTLASWRKLFEISGFHPKVVRGFQYDFPIRAPTLPLAFLKAVGRTPGPRVIPASELPPSGRVPPPRERAFDVLLHPRVVLSYALEPLCRITMPDRWATHGLFVLRRA